MREGALEQGDRLDRRGIEVARKTGEGIGDESGAEAVPDEVDTDLRGELMQLSDKRTQTALADDARPVFICQYVAWRKASFIPFLIPRSLSIRPAAPPPGSSTVTPIARNVSRYRSNSAVGSSRSMRGSVGARPSPTGSSSPSSLAAPARAENSLSC